LVFENRPHEITVSIGIVESTMGFIETEQQLIQRARIALEQAKHNGGNCTVNWAEVLDAQPRRGPLDQLTIQGVSHRIERIRQQLRCTYVESTRALVAAVEAKDPYTREHSLTVSTFAEAIGKRMRLSAPMLETLRAAALLHDVGKIGVPDAILTKPGPLTPEEFEVIRRHPETGLEILGHVSFLSDERPLILHHHERYDGFGYPAGLAGDEIPIGARILAVADALEAMFSARSYKEAYDLKRVRAEVAAGAGRQFDPGVAQVALRWMDESPEVVSNAVHASVGG
jgi:putative nucleotidyltransferase with HDIG domain